MLIIFICIIGVLVVAFLVVIGVIIRIRRRYMMYLAEERNSTLTKNLENSRKDKFASDIEIVKD